MPNHMHGIVHMKDAGLSLSSLALYTSEKPAFVCGDMVGAYKSLVFNECLEIYKSNNQIMGKLWQRNFYEHIIRNEKSYNTISDYIINNPATWNSDKFYVPDE